MNSIGLAGGVNAYACAPNPIRWTDPLGPSNYIPAPKESVSVTTMTRAAT